MINQQRNYQYKGMKAVVKESIEQQRRGSQDSSRNSIDSQQVVYLNQMNQIQEESAFSPMDASPKDDQFQLVVSDSSSDSDLSLSPVFLKANETINKNAQVNLKQVMKNKPNQQRKVDSQPPLDNQISLKRQDTNNEKKRINFLKSLVQNHNLDQGGTIDEFYEAGNIVVNMVSKDMMTFLRLQNEAEELKRKQDDFNQHKQRHFNLAWMEVQRHQERVKENTPVGDKNSRKSWWMGVALAKRFLRQGKRSKTPDHRLNNEIRDIRSRSKSRNNRMSVGPVSLKS